MTVTTERRYVEEVVIRIPLEEARRDFDYPLQWSHPQIVDLIAAIRKAAGIGSPQK